MANEARVDKNLLQDVIDSILAHGDKYTEKLKNLNKEFPAPIVTRENNPVRKYQSKF